MSVRGMFGGVIALALLQAVVSSTKSAQRTAGIWSAVTTGFAHFMSPTVAAIPDIRDRKKWDTVAPGDPGKVPYSSNTLPDNWTTKPQAPAAPASANV